MIERISINPDTDREHWLALRRQDVTASVAAALLGVHPFKTRYQLWHEKAGKIQEDEAETQAMIRGRVLEAPAIELLRIDRPKWKVWRPNEYVRQTRDRMGATPDAYAIDPERPGFGVVQIKSVEKSIFAKNWRDENGEIEPPLWIVIQALQEAWLSGANWACIVAFVIGYGLELHVIDVPIHEGVIERLRDEVRKFWRSVHDDTPPEPDYAADAALIARLYSEDNGREIDLTGDNSLPAILEERAEIKSRMRADKARLAEIDAEIIAKLGEHERGYLPGWAIKRPLVHRRGYYVEPTSYRNLTIKRID